MFWLLYRYSCVYVVSTLDLSGVEFHKDKMPTLRMTEFAIKCHMPAVLFKSKLSIKYQNGGILAYMKFV